MSIKKIDNDIKKGIGERIKTIRGRLSQKAFAEKLSISQGYVSELEQERSLPGSEMLLSIKQFFNVNIDWLLTGDGSPYLYKEGGSKEGKGGELDEDLEVAKLMGMTREILKSDTEYGYSLALNIRSFHNSVKMHKEVRDLQDRVGRIEREKAKEMRIRESDPLEQKEELLQKRAM